MFATPFYGSRPPSSLRVALIRIGIRDLRKFDGLGHDRKQDHQVHGRPVERLARGGAISESIAQLVRTKDLDDAFLCGLRSDFETVIINQVIGKPYPTSPTDKPY